MTPTEPQILALRVFQVLVISTLGLFGGLIFLDNILDYDANFQFVRHVLSMDTIFEGNTQKWRSIEDPIIHHGVYVSLIATEALFAVLCFWGGVDMFLALQRPVEAFAASKTNGYFGLGVGFLIWFFGFVVIGAEWFGMWQSTEWNGKETGMQISIFLLLAGVLLSIDK